MNSPEGRALDELPTSRHFDFYDPLSIKAFKPTTLILKVSFKNKIYTPFKLFCFEIPFGRVGRTLGTLPWLLNPSHYCLGNFK